MPQIIRIVDLETTGLVAPEHAPCEVGWIDLVSSTSDLSGAPTDWRIDEGSMRDMLCNPSRPIPPETSAIHHIVDEDVAGKMFWPGALAECAASDSSLFRPDVFAAHNAKFERQWLTDDITGGAPWVCSYKCALRVWPESPTHSNQGLRYWLRPEGLSRDVASKAHRAAPDAYVTAFLLRELLLRAPLDDLIKWSSEPAILPRITFGQHRGTPWSEVESGFIEWVLKRDFDDDVLHTASTELSRRKAARLAARAEHDASRP